MKLKVFITEVLFQSVRKTRLYELGVKLWDITDIRNEKWDRAVSYTHLTLPTS